jgi:hypothetical protein
VVVIRAIGDKIKEKKDERNKNERIGRQINKGRKKERIFDKYIK